MGRAYGRALRGLPFGASRLQYDALARVCGTPLGGNGNGTGTLGYAPSSCVTAGAPWRAARQARSAVRQGAQRAPYAVAGQGPKT